MTASHQWLCYQTCAYLLCVLTTAKTAFSAGKDEILKHSVIWESWLKYASFAKDSDAFFRREPQEMCHIPCRCCRKRVYGSNLLLDLPLHFQDGTELVTEQFISASLNSSFYITKEQYAGLRLWPQFRLLGKCCNSPALLWVLWQNLHLVFALLLFVSQERLKNHTLITAAIQLS